MTNRFTIAIALLVSLPIGTAAADKRSRPVLQPVYQPSYQPCACPPASPPTPPSRPYAGQIPPDEFPNARATTPSYTLPPAGVVEPRRYGPNAAAGSSTWSKDHNGVYQNMGGENRTNGWSNGGSHDHVYRPSNASDYKSSMGPYGKRK